MKIEIDISLFEYDTLQQMKSDCVAHRHYQTAASITEMIRINDRIAQFIMDTE